jgi:hypothetical protein
MHAFSIGLGGKHLWPALQLYLSDLGKVALHTVDQQWVLYHTEHKIWTNIYIYRVSTLPRWRAFNHFDQIIEISFSDATKLEQLMKVSFAQSALPAQ